MVSLTGWFPITAQISISTSFSSNIPAGTSVEADVKINKGNLGNFAKYQMDVPPGYSVAGIDVKGGNFTFENQRAKIVWVAVPSEPEFAIKLKITGEASATNQGTIAQKFFYLENNEKKEVEGPSVSLDGTASADAVTQTSGTAPAANTNTVAVQSVPVEDAKPAGNTPGNDGSTNGGGYASSATSSPASSTPTVAVETVKAPEEPKPVTTHSAAKTSTPPATERSAVTSTPPATTSTASADGMSYKIQLGAFSNEPSKGRFANAGNVSIDRVDGLYKVTTGSFSSKEEAFRRREELVRKGYDAFVVTYKNGLRVR